MKSSAHEKAIRRLVAVLGKEPAAFKMPLPRIDDFPKGDAGRRLHDRASKKWDDARARHELALDRHDAMVERASAAAWWPLRKRHGFPDGARLVDLMYLTLERVERIESVVSSLLEISLRSVSVTRDRSELPNDVVQVATRLGLLGSRKKVQKIPKAPLLVPDRVAAHRAATAGRRS